MKIQNVHINDEVIPHVDGVSIKDMPDEALRNLQLIYANKLRTALLDRRKVEEAIWALTMIMGDVDGEWLTLEV